MTAPEQTLNVTVAQIEDALLAGQTVPDFAREWSEPPANVLAIYRRLQREGRLPTNGPVQVATKTPVAPVAGARPLASVPQPTTGSAPSVDALASAAARSASKRTQALGAKLLDLAAVVRQRLADERVATEAAEKTQRERQQAAAEVERLKAELAAAQAKLRPARRGGSGTVSPRKGRTIDDEQRAKMLAGQRNDAPCDKGCGVVAKTKSGKAAHERHCTGTAS